MRSRPARRVGDNVSFFSLLIIFEETLRAILERGNVLLSDGPWCCPASRGRSIWGKVHLNKSWARSGFSWHLLREKVGSKARKSIKFAESPNCCAGGSIDPKRFFFFFFLALSLQKLTRISLSLLRTSPIGYENPPLPFNPILCQRSGSPRSLKSCSFSLSLLAQQRAAKQLVSVSSISCHPEREPTLGFHSTRPPLPCAGYRAVHYWALGPA